MNIELYGFEDYKVFSLYSSILFTPSAHEFYPYYKDKDSILTVKEEEVKGGIFYINYIKENADALKEAKTLYVHPNCEISRALISQKYKKSLNPFLADAVIIPKYQNDALTVDNDTLFINEKKKMVFIIGDIYIKDNIDFIKGFKPGTKFRDMAKGTLPTYSYRNFGYSVDDLYDSAYEGMFPCIWFGKQNHYLMEILVGMLPKSKLVYEDTVLKSLSNEYNKPTLESLISIKEMLESTDSDTVGSAIKALSMMDYINYPNSIIITLEHTNNKDWRYNPATNTTAAKYMFKKLNGRTARYLHYSKSCYISSEDYDLLSKLLKQFEHNDMQILYYLKSAPYTYEDEHFNVHPRIKP